MTEEEQFEKIFALREKICQILEGCKSSHAVNALLYTACTEWARSEKATLEDLQEVVGLFYSAAKKKNESL